MNRINAEFRRDTHKDPHQLEREIDATRAELEATLEELEHRLSPSDLFGQLWSQVRAHGGEFGGNLGKSLKDNPVPALLTSIGIAWMMASNGRPHNGGGRASMSAERMRAGRERMRASKHRMRERVHGAREAMRHGGESAREGIVSARERVSSSAHAMGDRARSVSARARYRAHRASSGFGHMLDEQPLLLGAIGLAAGVIAGAALPPTEQEDRAFGTARDRALDRAKLAGAEGARRMRERAEDAAEHAKSAMHEQREQRAEERASERSSQPATESPTQTSSPGTGLGY